MLLFPLSAGFLKLFKSTEIQGEIAIIVILIFVPVHKCPVANYF